MGKKSLEWTDYLRHLADSQPRLDLHISLYIRTFSKVKGLAQEHIVATL